MNRRMLGLVETIVVSLPKAQRVHVDREQLLEFLCSEHRADPDEPVSLFLKGMVFARRRSYG